MSGQYQAGLVSVQGSRTPWQVLHSLCSSWVVWSCSPTEERLGQWFNPGPQAVMACMECGQVPRRCPLLDFSSLLFKKDAELGITELLRDRASLEI